MAPMLIWSMNTIFSLLLSLAFVLTTQVRLNYIVLGVVSSKVQNHTHADHSHHGHTSHHHSHEDEDSNYDKSNHHASDTTDGHKPIKHRHSPFEPEHEHEQPHQVASTVVAIDHATVSNISWPSHDTSRVRHFVFYEDELYLSFLRTPLFRPPIRA
jgi:hypothetical protein